MSPAYMLGLVVGRLVGPLVTGVVDGMFGAPDDVHEAPIPAPVPATTCGCGCGRAYESLQVVA